MTLEMGSQVPCLSCREGAVEARNSRTPTFVTAVPTPRLSAPGATNCSISVGYNNGQPEQQDSISVSTFAESLDPCCWYQRGVTCCDGENSLQENQPLLPEEELAVSEAATPSVSTQSAPKRWTLATMAPPKKSRCLGGAAFSRTSKQSNITRVTRSRDEIDSNNVSGGNRSDHQWLRAKNGIAAVNYFSAKTRQTCVVDKDSSSQAKKKWVQVRGAHAIAGILIHASTQGFVDDEMGMEISTEEHHQEENASHESMPLWSDSSDDQMSDGSWSGEAFDTEVRGA